MFSVFNKYLFLGVCSIGAFFNSDKIKKLSIFQTSHSSWIAKQDEFEKKLSIDKPLFDEEKAYNWRYHFSKGAPYWPYKFTIKSEAGDFAFLKLGFHYNYKSDKRFIFFQIPSSSFIEEYDKDVFDVEKIEDYFVYSTKNIKDISRIAIPSIRIDNDRKDTVQIRKNLDQPTPNCQEIGISQLASIILDKKILFMTGAGLSYQKIPSYTPIANKMSTYTAEEIIKNPQLVFDELNPWFDFFFTLKPGDGHFAIYSICKLLNCGIITGNFDMLQQQTGIIPFRIQGHLFGLYEKDFKLHSKKIELLFVIGTSRDIRGQINRFREVNKHLKVVAVSYDGEMPCFMQDGDFLLFGDLNRILPELYQELLAQNAE